MIKTNFGQSSTKKTNDNDSNINNIVDYFYYA